MHAILLTVTIIVGANPVDFDTDVLPVLTKAGCNAAACHGAAAGRGGFKLSLFGGDPESDFHSIVHELEGRRVNVADPERSLALLKPTGEIDHEGGLRLEPDGKGALTLVDWIRQGARRKQLRALVRFVVEPSDVFVEGPTTFKDLKAIAHFDDGTRRDVTSTAVYYPGDPAAVEADEKGRLTVHRRGRHTVVVRYLTSVTTIGITVPLTEDEIDLSNDPRANWIDDEILRTLESLRLPPSPQADDATLLRRLRLDLTGRLPPPEEVRAYLADRDQKKHEKLLARLLESYEFAEYWTYKLAKLLRVRSQPQETQGALAFHTWLREQIQRRTSLNTMAAALLVAEGDSHEYGPANFYRMAAGPREQAEYVSEVLMGARLRCANCHNHPLDRWTQDDYHGLAAIFARVQRGRVVSLGARGEVTHPATGEPAVPKIPGGDFLAEDVDDPRQALSDWLTARDNAYFARAMVNRVWQALMGRGLIEPADDLRDTNPATHPRLLERLTADFVAHDYDLRHTIRLIASSSAYARSSQPTATNRADDRFYSHALTRPLEPEVLADAIADVTGAPDRYGDQPLGTRAVALFDPRTPSDSLDILGRCSREDSCESGGEASGGLTTKLHLINGPLINDKLAAKNGRLAQAIEDGQTNEQIVEQLYLRALGRFPRDAERAYWIRQFDGAGEGRRQTLEDFAWGLLNCREFVTNH